MDADGNVQWTPGQVPATDIYPKLPGGVGHATGKQNYPVRSQGELRFINRQRYKQYLGTPRIAARSENDTINARYPIRSGGASAGKCTSGSSVSMEAICAKFGVVEITAASSPGPKATQSPAARSPSPRVMASINANSLRIGVSGSCSPRLRCCAHLGQDDPTHR